MADKPVSKKMDARRVASVVMCTALVVGGVVGLVAANNAQTDAQEASKKNQATISTLEDNLKQVSSTSSDATGKSGQEIVSSAKAAGDAVAESQTKYITIDSNDSDGIKAIKTDIQKYFDEKSSTDAGAIWYRNSQPGNYSWEFIGGYTFSGDTTKSMWLCKDKDSGVVYAYATATYNVSKEKFTDFSKTTTLAGNSAMAGTQENDNKTIIDGLIDDIRKSSGDSKLPGNESDSNDYTDIWNARDKARQEAMKGGSN